VRIPGDERVTALSAPGPRGSSPPALGLLAGLLAFALAIFVLAGLANIRKCDAQSVCLSYGGGPIESNHFQGAFEPSSPTRLNGAFDKWFTYPISVRVYTVSDVAGEGSGEKGVGAEGPELSRDVLASIPATTKDRISVDWQVTVYFKLNTNLLRPFHEQLGLRYEAFEDSGWDRMLRQTFRKQLETSLARVTRRYDVAEVWADEMTLREIERAVGLALKDQVNSGLGGSYFCGPKFRPGSPACPDFQLKVKKPGIPSSVRKAFERNRTSRILVTTKANEIEQRAKEGQAIRKVRRELSPEYVLLRAIERGGIDFWVLPQSGNLTLPAPPGGR